MATDPPALATDWSKELFSDDWGTYWVVADDRTAADAIALAASWAGPFDEEPTARIVTGRVTERGGEPWFQEDAEATDRFWRVDAE